MSSPQEARRQASNVNSANIEISRETNRCQISVDSSHAWWPSIAGQALRSEFQEIYVEISSMLMKMNNLENALHTLSSRISQADEDRRRQLEQQANQNRFSGFGTTFTQHFK